MQNTIFFGKPTNLQIAPVNSSQIQWNKGVKWLIVLVCLFSKKKVIFSIFQFELSETYSNSKKAESGGQFDTFCGFSETVYFRENVKSLFFILEISLNFLTFPCYK